MDMSKIFEKRIANVREALRKHKIDTLVLTNLEEKKKENIRYLTGFTGSSSICVLTPDRGILITDPRYRAQAKKEVQSPWEVRIRESESAPFLKCVIQELGVERAGVIGSQVTIDNFYKMRRQLRPTKIVCLPDIMLAVQGVKDKLDLLHIQESIQGIEQALEHVFTLVHPGVSELDLARELAMALPPGAEIPHPDVFPLVIASGAQSAMPHGIASAKIIQEGDIVQFDVGCILDGYYSDISRIVIVGQATDEHKRMHHALQEAIRESLKLYYPGISVKRAGEKADEVLSSYGYPKLSLFHSLGHGLGLRIHEDPRVSPKVSESSISDWTSCYY